MYELFAKLMQEKGVRAADVSKATGIAYSTFSDWKAGRYEPKIDKICKIANYFEVSLDYFIRGNAEGVDIPDAPSEIPGQTELTLEELLSNQLAV